MANESVVARQIAMTGLLLFLFAVVGTGLVAVTFDQTRERIARNEREALLRSLHQIVPPATHDNDLFADAIEVRSRELLGTREPVTVYRAWDDGEPAAAVFTSIAPDGYSGAIKLLVGVRPDGSVSGVRVVAHKETPGLGDAIELERSDWIRSFTGRSLGDPPVEDWKVERDGGVFDQFTGATITPRAVVKAVRKTLIYFERNKDKLFSRGPGPTPRADAEKDAGNAPATDEVDDRKGG